MEEVGESVWGRKAWGRSDLEQQEKSEEDKGLLDCWGCLWKSRKTKPMERWN